MAKRESIKHTNECQFYITLRDRLSNFDGKYVAFGRLISGMRILKLIETEGINEEKPCIIVGCGMYQYMVDLPSLEEFAIKYENIKGINKQIKKKLKNSSLP